MGIQIKDKGIFTHLGTETDLQFLENQINSVFSYKIHRYIHILCSDITVITCNTFSFFSHIKELPIILILETHIPKDILTINKLYASGVDIAIFWIDGDSDEKIIEEAKTIFSEGSLIVKRREYYVEHNDFANYIPFIAEDSFFEKIKRKIWIDISNLKRRLKVKEVEDSYNASGL